MKTLYLLRHAKAEPGGKDLDDRDRPLSARGREACLAMGRYMKAHVYAPSLALSSPSLRTRETLAQVLQAGDMQVPERFIDKLYLATADEILHYVRLVSDKLSSVMVVGHNPGMHHAALVLAASERTELRRMLELKYPTGTLTVLHFSTGHWHDVAPGQGELLDFVAPQSLS